MDLPDGQDLEEGLHLRIGDVVHIYPSESCTINLVPYGIVEVDNANFEVKAVAEGECEIILTCTLADLRGQQIRIKVFVTK